MCVSPRTPSKEGLPQPWEVGSVESPSCQPTAGGSAVAVECHSARAACVWCRSQIGCDCLAISLQCGSDTGGQYLHPPILTQGPSRVRGPLPGLCH